MKIFPPKRKKLLWKTWNYLECISTLCKIVFQGLPGPELKEENLPQINIFKEHVN